ncbi:MAG: cytochrome c-type biogenesis protein CcmH [Chloroflexi bacterium]|nr:cytochrome c-type biogenesis protein CcmH [Chloroflexota bacterium]
MKRFLVVVALFFVLGGFVGSAMAQGSGPTDDEVNAIAKNLYCPVCENVPLDVCPTLACQQWRQLIADQLAAGKSEKEIYDYFVAQYGDRVLAAPPASGLNWLVYVVPPAVILLGGALLIRTMRRWRPASTQKAEEHPSRSDAYTQQMEEELKARRG